MRSAISQFHCSQSGLVQNARLIWLKTLSDGEKTCCRFQRHFCKWAATKSSWPCVVSHTMMPNCSVGNPEPRISTHLICHSCDPLECRRIRVSFRHDSTHGFCFHANAGMNLKFSLQDPTHGLQSIRVLGHDIIVCRTVDCSERSMLTQCEQEGHHGFPYSLFNVRDVEFVISQRLVEGCPWNNLDTKYHHRPFSNVHPRLQHGFAGKQVEHSNAIDEHHCCGWVLFCQRLQCVTLHIACPRRVDNACWKGAVVASTTTFNS